jgi:uncharacterized protein (TIGR02118 family)
MIKVLSPANLHPGRRSLAEFQHYWKTSHGPLFANTAHLRRYVQHLTLPESYGGLPNPTHDGMSMFWYDDLDALRAPAPGPEAQALREAVREDDRQLFDRLPGWPTHHKRASVIAEERIVKDGPVTPGMVKAIWIALRKPGLTPDELFTHWYEVHGPLAARVPQIRRYVQNHAIPEGNLVRPMTHDGWSEAWFDDLESLQAAQKTPEWADLRADGADLFATPLAIGIARETVQKWDGWQYNDWGAAAMSEAEIRDKLRTQRFGRLAADAKAPGQIRDAGLAGALAVWTDEHIVTIDASRIDERPDGERERLKL